MNTGLTPSRSPDVIVVGAGVIGLAIAWRCLQRGLTVTVLDPRPGSGASTTAAGMLAPVTELNYGELDLLRFGVDSARRYPAFAAELADATGAGIGFRPDGTVVAAWDGADLAALHDLHALQTSLGLAAELVTGRELRRLEPALAPGLPGGLLAGDDHQVDNRLLHRALLNVVGPRIIAEAVTALNRPGDHVGGVTLQSGRRLSAPTVVLAAGAWSTQIDGVPADVLLRPVKGQTLRLRASGPPPVSRTVRGSVKGSRIYIVPRADGEIVVGASSEEVGFDLTPRAGAIYELLRDAQSLVPALGEAHFVEVSTSLRPTAPDNAPIIGPCSLPGLILAIGHYRNGILLTPITGDTVAELIVTGVTPELLAPFAATRFTPAEATG